MTAKEFTTIQRALGMSALELSVKLHVHKRTVQKWSAGERKINGLVAETMRRMASARKPRVAKQKAVK